MITQVDHIDLGGLWLAAAERFGETRRFAWTEDGEEVTRSLTFSSVATDALAIAARLAAERVAGQRVILLYPPGLELVTALGGVALAGAVAVPVWPPDPLQLERSLPRFRAVASDVRATAVATTSAVLGLREMICAHAPELAGLPWIATDAVDAGEGRGFSPVRARAGELALIQYTSGSTGQPRGVMLSHANLLANTRICVDVTGGSAASHVVSWLPQFHDMGLVSSLLGPLLAGSDCTLLSPLAFVERPLRWLRAMTRFAGTIAGGPNFAWELCVRKIPAEALAELDLRAWRCAFNGAEPVRAATLAAFADRFAVCGFNYQAFCPCYGMAECVVCVAFDRLDRRTPIVAVDRAALAAGRVTPAGALDPAPVASVSCGPLATSFTAAIVEPETGRRRGEEQVGEIWLRGPCVGLGYWNDEAATAATFRARIAGEDGAAWLATGDLGFVRAGELHVTGRRKDLIIVRGRNLAPQDLEATAEAAHGAVRAGCVAAVRRSFRDEETVAVIAEVDPTRLADDADAAIAAIRTGLARAHAVAPTRVVLVPPRALPKTSSGKLRRAEAAELLARGELRIVAEWSEPEPPQRTVPALRAWLAGRLGVAVEEITDETRLDALGLDSLQRVELLEALGGALGTTVAADVLLGDLSLGDVLRRAGVRAPPGVRGEGPVVLPQPRVGSAPASVLPQPRVGSTLASGDGPVVLPRSRPVGGEAPAVSRRVGAEALAVLTGFRSLSAGPAIPQRRLREITAYLYAAARCVEERVRDAGRADAVLAEETRRVDRFGVSEQIIATRAVTTMPEAWLGADAELNPVDAALFAGLAEDPRGAPLEARLAVFDRIVQDVAARGYPAGEEPPDEIVHVTTTGYLLPSPVERFVARRGWLATGVTHAYHMGCYGAIPGVRIAEGLLSSRLHGARAPRRIDVFHSEVNGIHFNPTQREPSDVIGATLFGDGFVRYSLVHASRDRPPAGGGLALLAAHEAMIADSSDDMTWLPGSHNFRVYLSPQVPAKIGAAIAGFVQGLLARAGLDFAAERERLVYAVHPGGSRIVDAVQEALGLRPEQLARSREVLRRHGNMASATLPTIWSGIVADPAVAPHTRVVIIGLGPGLNAAGLLAEKLA